MLLAILIICIVQVVLYAISLAISVSFVNETKKCLREQRKEDDDASEKHERMMEAWRNIPGTVGGPPMPPLRIVRSEDMLRTLREAEKIPAPLPGTFTARDLAEGTQVVEGLEKDRIVVDPKTGRRE